MSAENSQKLCIECRAMVPLDVENCPECGYPFDDDFIKRCINCGSLMVADLECCPACGRPVETMATMQPIQQQASSPESSTTEPTCITPLFSDQQVAASALSPSSEQLMAGAAPPPDGNVQSAAMLEALQNLISAVQAGGRRNDEMMQRLTDTITALKSELYELKVAQQQTTADDSADQIAALSNEIAVLSAQQKSVEQKILAAVNEGSAKYTPVVLPASLKWLDYILIAVVLVLIFSIGNMLLMAYIAKLIMQE